MEFYILILNDGLILKKAAIFVSIYWPYIFKNTILVLVLCFLCSWWSYVLCSWWSYVILRYCDICFRIGLIHVCWVFEEDGKGRRSKWPKVREFWIETEMGENVVVGGRPLLCGGWWCDSPLWMASNVAGDGEEGVLDWTRFGWK